MSAVEAELWAMLHAVESDTLARYTKVSALGTPLKHDAVEALEHGTTDAPSLEEAGLQAPIEALLTAAAGDGSEDDVVLLQGFLLERLGVTIYDALARGGRLSALGAARARLARSASEEASAEAVRRLVAGTPDPQARFQRFTSRSHALFARLDALGEALDTRFAEHLDLHFADVMGDFVADLVTVCEEELGFQRRKVIVHLTGALMS